jgi:hypothetical protein
LRSITNKGYEVMFDFMVKAHNEAEEFKEQQRILLAIAREAEQAGIQFSRYSDLLDIAQNQDAAPEHVAERKKPAPLADSPLS